MSTAIEWVKAHRAWFGWLTAGIAASVAAAGHPDASKYIGMVSTLLLGAGHFESDAAKQGK